MKITLSPEGKRFWGTKRNSLTWIECEPGRKVSTYGAYWDGGSRNNWYIQTPTERKSIPGIRTSPFDTAPTAEVEPSENVAVVCNATFRGKDGFITVYVLKGTKWIN